MADSFELRRDFGGAKHAQLLALEQIDNPRHQRAFGADHRQIDLVRLGEADEGRNVVGRDWHVFALAFARGASIAGRDQHPLDARALRDLPGQRMLSAAIADY